MASEDRSNIHKLDAFSADDLLSDIVELRGRIITAWRERAVMLTRDEQRQLLDEIKGTCRLLGDLVQ